MQNIALFAIDYDQERVFIGYFSTERSVKEYLKTQSQEYNEFEIFERTSIVKTSLEISMSKV